MNNSETPKNLRKQKLFHKFPTLENPPQTSMIFCNILSLMIIFAGNHENLRKIVNFIVFVKILDRSSVPSNPKSANHDKLFLGGSGVRRGVGGSNSPEPGKPVAENDVLSEGSVFSNRFSPKIEKNSIFILNFHQKCSDFSQNFPNQLCFSSKRSKF